MHCVLEIIWRTLLYFNHILRDESSKGLRGFDCISKKTSCSADWNSVNLHQCRLSIRRFLLSRLIYNVYGLTFSITVSTLKICLCSSLSTFSLSLLIMKCLLQLPSICSWVHNLDYFISASNKLNEISIWAESNLPGSGPICHHISLGVCCITAVFLCNQMRPQHLPWGRRGRRERLQRRGCSRKCGRRREEKAQAIS